MMIGSRTAAVLGIISASIRRRGYPPTLREIAEQLGSISSNGVRYHLLVLERAGFIQRDPKVSRGIKLINDLEVLRPQTAEPKPRVGVA